MTVLRHYAITPRPSSRQAHEPSFPPRRESAKTGAQNSGVHSGPWRETVMAPVSAPVEAPRELAYHRVGRELERCRSGHGMRRALRFLGDPAEGAARDGADL